MAARKGMIAAGSMMDHIILKALPRLSGLLFRHGRRCEPQPRQVWKRSSSAGSSRGLRPLPCPGRMPAAACRAVTMSQRNRGMQTPRPVRLRAIARCAGVIAGVTACRSTTDLAKAIVSPRFAFAHRPRAARIRKFIFSQTDAASNGPARRGEVSPNGCRR